MKKYFIEFKPFLLFLVKFFAVYFVLTFAYRMYLSSYDEKNFEVDGFTQMVSNQTIKVISLFENDVYQMPNLKEASVNVVYKKEWNSRIIEGCNALSVIILFISFIIAFTGRLKHTILFIIGGSLLIHFFNVVRIASLIMLRYSFPEYRVFLHDIAFPLVIYGFVFLLWVIWVNKFSLYAKK